MGLIVATFVMFVAVTIITFALNETGDSAYVTIGILVLLFFTVYLGIPIYCLWAGIATTGGEATMMIVFGLPAIVFGLAVSQLQKANKKIAELEAKITPPPAKNKPQ